METTYAIFYFDVLRVKVRDEGLVRNKAVYLVSVRRLASRQQSPDAYLTSNPESRAVGEVRELYRQILEITSYSAVELTWVDGLKRWQHRSNVSFEVAEQSG